MSGLFGGPPALPAPPPPPPPPKRADVEVQAAARDERLRRTKAQGRASTILTGGQGVAPAEGAAVKTLLGA